MEEYIIDIYNGNVQSGIKSVNNYLSEGWKILQVDQLPNHLIYVLKRKKEKKLTWNKTIKWSKPKYDLKEMGK